MVFNPKPHISDPQVKLYGAVIEVSTQEQHLGIERVPSNNPRATVQCRIKDSRSVYRLFGAGLYGYNGVGPRVSLQMIKTYIIPTLTYGLKSIDFERS